MRLRSKHPDAAPRCLQCGYNLHGLAELRCPECGWRIESMEDLEQARWLAPQNEQDWKWLRRQRLIKLWGTGLLLLGLALVVSLIALEPGAISCAILVFFGIGVIGTIVFLFVCYSVRDSGAGPLHIAGWAWFAAGVVLWLMLLW